jgi:hypothetical protein
MKANIITKNVAKIYNVHILLIGRKPNFWSSWIWDAHITRM